MMKGHFRRETKRRREFQKRYLPLQTEEGFAAYAKAAQDCLAAHGCPKALRLQEDLTRQSKLASWMEYLVYCYCEVESSRMVLEDIKDLKERAWARLVESEVVLQTDTPEALANFTSPANHSQYDDEKRTTEELRDKAKDWFNRVETESQIPHDDFYPPSDQRIMAAKAIWDEKLVHLRWLESRRSLCEWFSGAYAMDAQAKDRWERRMRRRQWVQDQIVLVEAETELEAARAMTDEGSIGMTSADGAMEPPAATADNEATSTAELSSGDSGDISTDQSSAATGDGENEPLAARSSRKREASGEPSGSKYRAKKANTTTTTSPSARDGQDEIAVSRAAIVSSKTTTTTPPPLPPRTLKRAAKQPAAVSQTRRSQRQAHLARPDYVDYPDVTSHDFAYDFETNRRRLRPQRIRRG
ncbi:hypothetical protein S40288_11296 [Stachybotrys chartarum IBT 40288]|nr:hypothetical protein S40288_11296 [Stachybotrys chartarum IBT 40288]